MLRHNRILGAAAEPAHLKRVEQQHARELATGNFCDASTLVCARSSISCLDSPARSVGGSHRPACALASSSCSPSQFLPQRLVVPLH